MRDRDSYNQSGVACVGDLEAWLQQGAASEIPELAAFAKGVRRDLEAVQAQ